MTVANANLSEEALMSAWLGVNKEEAAEMDRQLEQMLVEIRVLQARTQAAPAKLERKRRQ